MKNEQPITVEADTIRRMQLNADRTPRQTVYNEATQMLNPITGKPYADGTFAPDCEMKRWIKEDFKKRLHLKNKREISYFGPFDKPELFAPRTNAEIELQKALGRMEARETGYDLFYGVFLGELDRLADAYAQNPALTLDSITDVNGLKAAIGAVEGARKPKKFPSKYFNNEFFSNDLYSIEKYIDLTPIIKFPK